MHVPILVLVFVGGYALCKYREMHTKFLRHQVQQPTLGVTSVSSCSMLPPHVPIITTQPSAPAGQQINHEQYVEPITVGIASGLGVALIEGLFA